jgi:predicted amidohydrolase
MTATALRVTLVQADLVWHDAAANRHRFDELLAPLASQTELVVLPEMFTTGFTMSAEQVAEPVDGPTLKWMRGLASRLNAVITGSVVTADAGRFYNRLIWMRPDGSHAHYDKRHLFRMAREHEHFAVGQQSLIVELHGWRIAPLVCYDLRFPVWSRNRFSAERGYDALIYVANWPERRRYAWQTLLRARAIENLSYCIAVNRVGRDGQGIEYRGDSVVLDYMGQPLTAPSEDAFTATVTLDRQALTRYRLKFPAHLDADDFEIR